MTTGTLIVLAKEPRPGFVKTRLTPPCSEFEAAALAEAALRDTLDVVLHTPARRRLVALDGSPGPWLPDGFDVIPQPGGSLDERIAHVIGVVEPPIVLIGMDTPQVTAELLSMCDFGACPAWLGPAIDGGFWLLGLAEPDPALVRGVPMSVPHTYAAQRQRIIRSGLDLGTLPALRDVDTWEDATAVAELAPATRFAVSSRALRCPA